MGEFYVQNGVLLYFYYGCAMIIFLSTLMNSLNNHSRLIRSFPSTSKIHLKYFLPPGVIVRMLTVFPAASSMVSITLLISELKLTVGLLLIFVGINDLFSTHLQDHHLKNFELLNFNLSIPSLLCEFLIMLGLLNTLMFDYFN